MPIILIYTKINLLMLFHIYHSLAAPSPSPPPYPPPSPPPPPPPIGPDRAIKCHAELGVPSPASCHYAIEAIAAIPDQLSKRHFTPNLVPGMRTTKVPRAFRGPPAPPPSALPENTTRVTKDVDRMAGKLEENGDKACQITIALAPGEIIDQASWWEIGGWA